MKKLIFLSALPLLFLYSCKKDSSNDPSNPTTILNPEEFYPYSLGSYWIYSIHTIDTNGVETDLGKEDSVYVSEVNQIDGFPFFSLNRTYVSGLYRWQIDSSGYLISSVRGGGRSPILFAPNDLSDPLSKHTEIYGPGDTNYVYTNRMTGERQTITVPAGTFEVLSLEENYQIKSNAPWRDRIYYLHRARNVGLVKFQFGTVGYHNGYIPDATIFEYRLVRYHIN